VTLERLWVWPSTISGQDTAGGFKGSAHDVAAQKTSRRRPEVDQSFVAGLGIDEGDRAIVDATVRLAQAFGLDVIAEGVETVELVHELLNLGCYRAQGFLPCRPKPEAELAPLLLRGGVRPSIFNQRDPAFTAIR
jgi:predicted signal transduction protein with EAL and GGDEF domain